MLLGSRESQEMIIILLLWQGRTIIRIFGIAEKWTPSLIATNNHYMETKGPALTFPRTERYFSLEIRQET